MPMMKLYFSKTSPYARKVRIAIEELGLADQVEEILADPFAPTAELLEANPLSKVPTLVTERNEEKKEIEYDYEKPASYFTPRQLQKFATTKN